MNSISTSAGAFAAALFKWMRFQFIVVIVAEIKHRSFLLRLGGALAAVVVAFFVAAAVSEIEFTVNWFLLLPGNRGALAFLVVVGAGFALFRLRLLLFRRRDR